MISNAIENGSIVVRKISATSGLTFDSGSQFSNLIFVAGEPYYEAVPEYDEDTGCRTGETSVLRYDLKDIVTGVTCNWGEHMFMSLIEFNDAYQNMMHMFQNNQAYSCKIRHDIDREMHDDYYGDADDTIRSMQIINCIIRMARFIVEPGFKIPTSILARFDGLDDFEDRTQGIWDQVKSIAEKKLFNIPTMDEIAAAYEENQKKAAMCE